MTNSEIAERGAATHPRQSTLPVEQAVPPEPRSFAQPFSRVLRRIAAQTTRQETLSLVDQVVASATSFLTTLIVGRIAGPHELGLYALGFSLVTLCFAVENSLVGVPYTVYAHRSHKVSQADYAGAVLIQVVLLSLLASLFMLGGTVAVSTSAGLPGLLPVLCVLAATVPFCLLREFARQAGFIHLRAAAVLVLDLSAAAIQLSGLVLLVKLHRLTAVSATVLMGLSAAIVSTTWLLLMRKGFRFRFACFFPAIKMNWAVGGWMFAGGLVSHFTSQSMILWILAFSVDETATGIFAAASQIIRITNPLVLGIGQVLGPKIAHAFNRNGLPAARRVVWSMTRLFALTMGGFCVATFLGGGVAVEMLFGSKYAGYEQVVTLMAAAALFSALALPPSGVLTVLERADVIFMASLIQGAVTLGLAVVLLKPWGPVGVACGLVAGQLAAFSVDWIAYFLLAHRAKVAHG
jgi:O-antigen/teichoic acid export membrane protein